MKQADRLEAARRTLASLQAAIAALEKEHPDLKTLKPMPSVSKTIDTVLGGPAAVARKLGVKPPTVSSYKRNQFFPPESYCALKAEIEAAGYEATPKKFRMRERVK